METWRSTHQSFVHDESGQPTALGATGAHRPRVLTQQEAAPLNVFCEHSSGAQVTTQLSLRPYSAYWVVTHWDVAEAIGQRRQQWSPDKTQIITCE